MIIAGLALGLVGSSLLMLVFGMPWWKLDHPMWDPIWSPLLQRAGGTVLVVGFILQIVGSLS